MALPEDSRLREMIFVSLGIMIAGVVSILFEGAYQLIKWGYKKYVIRFRKNKIFKSIGNMSMEKSKKTSNNAEKKTKKRTP